NPPVPPVPPVRGGEGGAAGPVAAGSWASRTFVAFQYPKYRLLWLSMAVGMTGMQMQMIAQGLLAYELAGTFTAVGVLAMAWGIPQFFFALPGGALADRMDKRRILLTTQAAVCVQALALAVMITTDVISLPILFAVGVFLGSTFSFNMPARQAFIPELVPREQMMNAIALNNTAMNATRVISPLAAGVFITVWGFDVAYYITAGMYALGWLTVVLLPRSTAHLARTEERGMFDDIRVGLRYVGGSAPLRVLMVLAFVTILLGVPYVTILPAFARADLGQGSLGFSFLVGMQAVGALVGSLVIATLNPRSGLPRIQSLLGLGWGAGLIGLGLGSAAFGFAGALVAMVVIGFFQMGYMALNNSMLMMTASPAYHGRVMSLYMLTFGVFPLMGGPLGLLGDSIGGFATFTLLGASLLAFVLLMMLSGAQLALTAATEAPAATSPAATLPAAATSTTTTPSVPVEAVARASANAREGEAAG
ncbi:MAG: MFS transporter, partial [Chloroflexi bacterium]|nr:MFS transporter [Chloroflexota bacterium]